MLAVAKELYSRRTLVWGLTRRALLARYRLGLSAVAERDFQQAVEHLARFVSNYPSNALGAEAYLQLGVSHKELGDADSARAAFDEAIERFPGTPWAEKAAAELLLLDAS